MKGVISLYMAFIVFWLTNSLLLYLANLIFPGSFVLGTYRLSYFWSGVVAALVWTVLASLSEPIRKRFNLALKGPVKMFLYYYLANFVALWLTARMAPLSGLGVASFVWVGGLALVSNVSQYLLFGILKLKT